MNVPKEEVVKDKNIGEVKILTYEDYKYFYWGAYTFSIFTNELNEKYAEEISFNFNNVHNNEFTNFENFHNFIQTQTNKKIALNGNFEIYLGNDYDCETCGYTSNRLEITYDISKINTLEVLISVGCYGGTIKSNISFDKTLEICDNLTNTKIVNNELVSEYEFYISQRKEIIKFVNFIEKLSKFLKDKNNV